MTKPGGGESSKYKEAKLQYLWAPVITGLVGLITAVVLHFVTDSKLGDASTNFTKLSDSVQSLTAEAKVNREELDRLEHMVDEVIDHLLARHGEAVAAADKDTKTSKPPTAPTAPTPPTAPAAPTANAQVAKLQDLKKQIATARLRTQNFVVPVLPRSLFEKK